MGMRYELLVFDWDGTLMDSAALIVDSVQRAAIDLGLEPPPESLARQVIGLGLEDALRHALPTLPEERYGELAMRYRHYYLGRDHELALFPGASELIAWLAEKGYRLAVATGKSRRGLERALVHSGLGEFFHASRCADECFSKPHPQMLEELMEEFGVERQATLMIGDTTHDLLMARNAGVDAVAVAYGAHEAERLLAHEPIYCAHSLGDLADWMKRHL
ncbi:MAG: HAD-IA family hydrolase [Rhodocyclaceae bacterium]|nr:HAD-IA family hydrolase [Rhodocyclaceae bacterium]